MIPLESLAACFQGLIPAWLCTCSRQGVPNVAILSHVDYVDARHIALSYQFFNKSKRNVLENPQALVRIYDPDTFAAYGLRLAYVRTETHGPVFDAMRMRIEAIASYSGLKGIFKLIGADIYEVVSIEQLETGAFDPPGRPAAAGNGTPVATFTMKALQDVLDRIRRTPSLDRMLDVILETLESAFGFRHSMILLRTEKAERLELIASRGYAEGGIGSEVAYGEGIIGVVAEARKPIRISGLLRHMLYANAVAEHARARGMHSDDRRVPLPGLAEPASQLGIPLQVGEELIGVLCIESTDDFRFHEEDRSYLEVLGAYVALAIQNSVYRERLDETQDPQEGGRHEAPRPPATESRPRLRLSYYGCDECMLVDGEYLVRGLPAKILRKMLREWQAEGRVDFTNRLLRLDRSLELPAYRDNLESRLILLRRRLEERCPRVRIVRTGRGHFRLELDGPVVFVEHP